MRDSSGLHYLLTDHLGSVVAVLDDDGDIESDEMSFILWFPSVPAQRSIHPPTGSIRCQTGSGPGWRG